MAEFCECRTELFRITISFQRRALYNGDRYFFVSLNTSDLSALCSYSNLRIPNINWRHWCMSVPWTLSTVCNWDCVYNVSEDGYLHLQEKNKNQEEVLKSSPENKADPCMGIAFTCTLSVIETVSTVFQRMDVSPSSGKNKDEEEIL